MIELGQDLITWNIVHVALQNIVEPFADVGDLRAVILQPCLPSAEMASLLRSPVFSIVITYLEGSPLSPRDLERARITSASAVFLLTNKFATDPDEEDAKVILQQFAMKRCVWSCCRSLLLLLLLLLRP